MADSPFRYVPEWRIRAATPEFGVDCSDPDPGKWTFIGRPEEPLTGTRYVEYNPAPPADGTQTTGRKGSQLTGRPETA
jgi:hypothetical protein